jgi:uncharacterized protein YndB with AHSA1/START domain
MTYDSKLERLIDAPPEVVFDTIVDPQAQPEIFADQVPGWELWECEIDLRVGGMWTFVFGPADRSSEADRSRSVFAEIDRPRRLVYRTSMFVSSWGRTVDFTETITFEDRHGKTLVTVEQSDLETEADRDAFLDGTPGYLDALERAVAARVADRGRHDSRIDHLPGGGAR